MTMRLDVLLLWFTLVVFVTCRNSTRELKNQGVTKADKDVGFLPNIFIVGGQKCGSSSLFELLMKHPLLNKGTHKEPHFFDGENEFKKGLEYYTTTFFPPRKADDNNPRQQRFMDGTPIFHKPIVWERIYNSMVPYVQCAGLKFIVLLREPVARDLSWYSHQTREQIFLGEPFSEIKTMKEKVEHVFTTKKQLTEEEQELFEKTFRGQYVDQLEAFTKVITLLFDTYSCCVYSPTLLSLLANYPHPYLFFHTLPIVSHTLFVSSGWPVGIPS